MRRSPRSRSRRDAEGDVFRALASVERRRMLDLLREHPGMHIAALGSHFEMSDVAVLKHVRVLEQAGLVISERQSRERRLWFNVMPIHEIYTRWTDEYSAFFAGLMSDIKTRVERRAQQRLAGQGARRA